jgi:hypothetical protein
MEIEIGNNTGQINEEGTELTVYFSPNGWDNRKQWREALESAANNENDSINEEVWTALEELGYELGENHVFDEDDESITYEIIKEREKY